MITLELWNQAEQLVRERITGDRKGMPGVPQWQHSFRVRDRLRVAGYPDVVCLAGLLHDIVEDGGITFEHLSGSTPLPLAKGELEGVTPKLSSPTSDRGSSNPIVFPERVVQLVHLASHDPSIPNHDARWVLMIANLIRARDSDAWAIKLADLADNLRDSIHMPPSRASFIRTVKTPLLLASCADLMRTTPLWQELDSLLRGA